MVRMGALGLCVGLGHICSRFGLAVVVRPIAVVDVARRIQPHETGSTTRRLRHRRGLCRGRGLRRWSSSRSRSGRWSRGRGLRSSRRRSSRRGGRSSGGRSRSRSVPLLHTLVSVARPLFAGGRRVSPVFTLTCRSGRRRLGHRNLRHQKSCRNRHQTNRCLHKLSQ